MESQPANKWGDTKKMAKEFIVIAKLTHGEHRKLKAMCRGRSPRIYIKDFVRDLVLRAIGKVA